MTFAEFDKDGSGFITREELQEAMKKVDPDATPADVCRGEKKREEKRGKEGGRGGKKRGKEREREGERGGEGGTEGAPGGHEEGRP